MNAVILSWVRLRGVMRNPMMAGVAVDDTVIENAAGDVTELRTASKRELFFQCLYSR
jgi:hypothetical protein